MVASLSNKTIFGALTVDSISTTATTLIVQGAALQRADLHQYQDSAAAVLQGVTSAGQTYIGPALPAPGVYTAAITAASGTGTTATLTVASSMGLSVGQWIKVSGVTPTGYNGTYQITAVPAVNQVSYSNATTGAQTVAGTVSHGSAQLTVTPKNAYSVGLTVKGVASQQGNIQEWQSSTGGNLASVRSDGVIWSSQFIQSSATLYGAGLSISGGSITNVGKYRVSSSLLGSGAESPLVIGSPASGIQDPLTIVNSSSNPIFTINQAGKIYDPDPASPGLVVSAAPSAPVAITAISGSGTVVTYTVATNANPFVVGQIVSITGATTTAYNLTSVAIASVTNTTFTVANAATGATSTATATPAAQTGNLQEWHSTAGAVLASINSTGGATFTGGSLVLSNATSNRINFGVNGVAAPTFTSYSAGTKLVLWDGIGASTAGYALGVEGSNMWFSVDSTTQGYKWYGGTTLAASLTGAGALTLVGDLTVSGGDIFTAAATASTLFSTTTTGNVAIAGGLTTGTFTAGATGSTGAVSLFPATGAQNITLGGATTGTVTLGSTLATAVQLPTGKTKIGQTTLVQGGAVSITLPTLAGTLYASGNTDVALLDGGTNASLTAANGGVVYSNATAMAITAAGTSGQVLTSNGAAAPTWQAVTVSGYVSQTNGTVTTAATGSTVVRNITLSTSAPSGGIDGDVWMQYS